MTEQTTHREHGTAGLTPTRLEVSESLLAADLEKIDEILGMTGAPDSDWEDQLDHLGLDDEDDGENQAAATSPIQLVEPVKEHHPARWAGPTL